MMTRTRALIESIRSTLESNHCKSVQLLVGSKDDAYCIKLAYIPNKKFKERVTNLIETQYCESVNKIKEGATYVIYQIATREQVQAELNNDPKYVELCNKLDAYIKKNYIAQEV